MSGGMMCSVATCKSNRRKVTGESLKFFSFPKNLVVQKQWVQKCYQRDKFDTKKEKICSKHFQPSDYEDEVMANIMGIPAKKLKIDAIPSLYLPFSRKETITESSRKERAARREGKEIVQALIQEPSLEVTAAIEVSPIVEPIEQSPSINISGTVLDSRDNEINILKSQVVKLEEENKALTGKLKLFQESEQKLKQKIAAMEMQLKELGGLKFEKRVKECFKDVLTSNQVDIALKKKSKARWTQEELSMAFTLRYFSKRAYIYLRQTLHYPLPAISTLQQWAANINLKNGILDDVLRIMDTAGQIKTPLKRITVLSYDEVKISSQYEYDQKEEEVIGPFSYMQVVMARGLFDNWKQPVYIGFDQKMTKQLLHNIITHLHTIKYEVIACVSDCGGGNQGLWKELNITTSNTSIAHPVTGNSVYFFADAPHLMKLLRNWLIDTGFVTSDGVSINKCPFVALIESRVSEISSCHRLTTQHVKCEKAQRQNVRRACQLLSHTTATALKRYRPGNDTILAQNVGNFTELVNNWFDVLNSYTSTASLPTKKPYGLELEMQHKCLNEMEETIEGMRCVGKNALQVFQKGILITSKSLQCLFTDLKERHGISYLLTHRLNQDCLENFFSQLRTKGGLHDHPSPLNAIYRVRMILLGKNPGMVQTHSNVEIPKEMDGEYLMAAAVKQAQLKNLVVTEPSSTEETELNESFSSESTASDAPLRKSWVEDDGTQYLAGFIAKKFIHKYPYLGGHSYKDEEALNLHSYAMPSWVQSLSFGGLIQPSAEWMRQMQVMETYFIKFHKDNFSPGKIIIKRTTNYIIKKLQKKKIDVPYELVKSFSKQRIFIRIKYLNLKRECTDRKRSSEGAERKRKCKIRKTIN
ncbi:hypothetical protein PPYR_02315 [Photinus pyralis]|uniref:THAP-type domain-containing protein n=1 Tax=Photinus pyralis TaxID=7054 RepID=A0A5N4B6W9_PHOPY|nr:hypothetical protein PPYR_02315 [Photinus pyralis]